MVAHVLPLSIPYRRHIFAIVCLISSYVCFTTNALITVDSRSYYHVQSSSVNNGNVQHQASYQKLIHPTRNSLLELKNQNNHSSEQISKRSKKKQHNDSSSSSSSSDRNNNIVSILRQINFGPNLITIGQSDLPVLAELYAGGESRVGIIKKFRVPKSFVQTITPPLLEVEIVPSSPSDNYEKDVVVDVGQITTIWPIKSQHKYTDVTFLSSQLEKSKHSLERDFPVNHCEVVMQDLYKQKSSPKKGGGLTKKEVKAIASMASTEDLCQHLDQVLRKIVKAGMGSRNRKKKGDSNSGKLVNSFMAGNLVYDSCDDYSKNLNDDFSDLIKRWMVGVQVLSDDAKVSGRFKRSSCIFVSTDYECDGNLIDEGDKISKAPDTSVRNLVLLNGGWIAVDESLRASAEARNLARRSKESSTSTNVFIDTNIASLKNEERQNGSPSIIPFTASDERIIYRLECLAMGETIETFKDDSEQEAYEKSLALDVREALKAMNLPLSSKGAQKALVQIGRWSTENKSMKTDFQPWSQQVLDTSKQLVDLEQKRRQKIGQYCSKETDLKSNEKILEGRIDLSSLPCLCIDAKRTTFRDDAIGVRPRSTTGREVTKGASKWEILIHIADVSDIYSIHSDEKYTQKFDPRPLWKASEGRGVSRYDLPNGPLHLMPPVALRALSLVTKSIDSVNNNSGLEAGNVNRCVTLWAYIDERDGKLLDVGVERSVIAAPFALSYEKASSILDTNVKYKKGTPLATVQAVLSIAERNLSLWSTRRVNTSQNAKKREKRLKVRELVAAEVMQGFHMRDDGASGSFQRTKGHRVVDSALDLYGHAISRLMKKEKAPIPRTSGNGIAKGGRLGSAPLRRYIDGIAQRQLISVLCNYGGPAMNAEECSKVSTVATNAINRVKNYSSMKNKHIKNSTTNHDVKTQQKKALQLLARHLYSRGEKCLVSAISTGRQNEVVIKGAGAVAKCDGVEGSLKPGERIFVQVTKLDVEKQILSVKKCKQEE